MQEEKLYSLILLDNFKSLMGIDDRDDKIARFCLAASTHTIEQYCKRRLLLKKHFERIEYHDDLFIPLAEYPVNKVLAVYVWGDGEILEPEFYSVIPDCGSNEDLPFSLSLSPALKRYRGLSAVKAVYWAGYAKALKTAAPMPQTPADLASACLELAAWNMNRYRGKRIGMSGNIRGSGIQGEHFELSMPENVKALLEPYRRKTI